MEETSLASGRSGRRLPPGTRAAPWLVFPYGGKGGNHQQAFYNICEPNYKTCRKFIPELSRKSYWQKRSHQGWLVIICEDDKVDYTKFSNNWKYGDCFLWNPVSLQTIQLPSLLDWFDHEYWIIDCVLSSPPKSTSPDDEDNSMVFLLCTRLVGVTHEQVLVFCRSLGDNKQWRRKELPRYNITEIIPQNHIKGLLSFRGKLYGMGFQAMHLEMDIQLEHVVDETLSIRSFYVSKYEVFPPLIGGDNSFRMCHIESFDELFRIYIYYSPRGTDKVVIEIQVLRLDFSLMEWENVESLGDHVLFIGSQTTASCSAAELGLTRGCLYYSLRDDQSLYRYDVEDHRITTILPCLKLPTPWSSADWVMMGTSVSIADARRRTTKDALGKEDNSIRVEGNKTSITNDEKEKHGQKHNGGELEVARPWGILTRDIVKLIASYLHPVDYGCFRGACKENRMLIPAQYCQYRRYSFTGIKTTINLFPWLVFPTDNDTIYNFVDPLHNNEKFLMNASEMLVGAMIRTSKGGWLLMSKGMRTIFFYNPFTRTMIKLPDLPKDYYRFIGLSVLSLPTSSDCIVFGIAHENRHEISLHIISRGNGFWRSRVFENNNLYIPCFNNPVFCHGAFYCLDYNGRLGVFNLKDELNWEVLTNPRGHFNAVYPSFLVECDGKLLLVDLGPHGKLMGIFRLDFSKMIWVKVESLGRHMMFVSHTSCISAVAPDIRMENKIYFPRLHGERILFYSLDTCRYHSFGSPHSAEDFYDTTELLNCTWVEPNWSKTTEQELDWLSI